MRGLPQKQNARRAYKIRLCGHLRRYKKIVKKTYIISCKYLYSQDESMTGGSDEDMEKLNELMKQLEE